MHTLNIFGAIILCTLVGCSSGNLKSSKNYDPPAAPPITRAEYDAYTPCGQVNALWQPPVADRAVTIVRPDEPSVSIDRPDYEGAPWATGTMGNNQSKPAGTF